MVRFQRQPPGTALTRASSLIGIGLAAGAGVLIVAREPEAAGALVALCASFLSSYVRARGAALNYSTEESHIPRGLRYGLVSLGLVFGWLAWTVWAAAAVAVLAAAVRTGQVAREERA